MRGRPLNRLELRRQCDTSIEQFEEEIELIEETLVVQKKAKNTNQHIIGDSTPDESGESPHFTCEVCNREFYQSDEIGEILIDCYHCDECGDYAYVCLECDETMTEDERHDLMPCDCEERGLDNLGVPSD